MATIGMRNQAMTHNGLRPLNKTDIWAWTDTWAVEQV
ncbi:hypothetical protein CCACVL1_29955 [Corchorus capsularis]|uniref:Uncharacterized protein n=1 Tax=Corchorus capsularis TaxID=210143 RepID=A0A1R3FZB9_COCAP|nr:hypothetical protein CCACVL1_29955 [Corchorus capsularis]